MQEKEQNTKLKYRNIILKVIWVLYAMISIIILLPKADELLCTNYEIASEHVNLNDSWNVQVHDVNYENVALNELNFTSVNKGDFIILERTLPEHLPYREGALRISIKHSAVRIFIEDKVIYEYGFERVEKNKTVGSGAQFINFPDSYAGKNIRIEFYVDENNAYTYLDDINIYQWEYALQALLT